MASLAIVMVSGCMFEVVPVPPPRRPAPPVSTHHGWNQRPHYSQAPYACESWHREYCCDWDTSPRCWETWCMVEGYGSWQYYETVCF